MRIYRVKKYFGIEYEHTTIFFPANSRWEDLGDHNGYTMLYRKDIFVDVTREQIRDYMVELKEQKQ